MKKTFIFAALLLFVVVTSVYAYDTNKPETHDANWISLHGEASVSDPDSCSECHTDRVECITCHQEVAPRSHNASWKRKVHAFKARWDRESCLTCHKEDSCVECHNSTPPISHRPGWGGTEDTQNRHCGSCHFPIEDTSCYTCHETSHSPQTYTR
jgi:hypothetical protein